MVLGILIISGLCVGCGSEVERKVQKNELQEIGTIGEEEVITRGQVAKMIALAFYTPKEIEALEKNTTFPDVTEKDWCYPYVNASTQLEFFSGDEEGFRPDDPLVLWEAQILMDRLAPEYENQMVLTEENRMMPVSYPLWVELYQTALPVRRDEDSMYSYGITKESQVLLYGEEENAFDRNLFGATGYDLEKYIDHEISFLAKAGEIIALLEVVDTMPTIENVYCKREEGLLTVLGAKEKIYTYKGEDFGQGLGNVRIEEGIATVVNGEQVSQDTIRRATKESLSLENTGILPWAEGFRIYDESLNLKKETSLICGTQMADFYILDGTVMGAIIKERPMIETMRVLLGGGGQDKISITPNTAFTLKNKANQKEFTSETAILIPELEWFNQGVLEVSGDMKISFGHGKEIRYKGNIEIEKIGEELIAVQPVPMEEYLLGVVPYEMPSSFGQSALEAQAICARSYAYNQFYANTYGEYGAHVIDTVASQVYMGADTTPEAELAVKATEGMCLVSEDKVAQTYFYSTSSGFGAKDVEVWSRDGQFKGTGKSYLEGQSHGVEEPMPTTEEEWLGFWQNWEVKGYDQDTPWYRWKVYFSASQLSEILKNTLVDIQEKNNELVTIKDKDGSFKKGEPKDLGKIQGIEIVQRGQSGVVQVVEITFENKTIRLATENAIRKGISPTKISIGEEIYLQRKGQDPLVGQSMLPSGFFSINEMKNEEDSLTGIAFYGGGYGHGVGLSQYGAKNLSEAGDSSEEILKKYFKGVEVAKVM